MTDIKHTPEKDLNKQAIKDNYIQALADLDMIQTTDLDNNAKLQLAVKGQAAMIEKLLKFIKSRLVD